MTILSSVVATIRRRVLVNATAAPDDVALLVPAPFRPQLVQSRAVVGVCLIRLEHLRPAGLPRLVGVTTENMAHRIAVEWDDEHGTQKGVYIPVRHSASWLTTVLGGRVLPGVHMRAHLRVEDEPNVFRFSANALGSALVNVQARPAGRIPRHSVFHSVADAEAFFAAGCMGYSPRRDGSFDGAQLRTAPWHLAPLALDDVFAAWFHPLTASSLVWDSAFVMRDVSCEWHLTTGGPTACTAPQMAESR